MTIIKKPIVIEDNVWIGTGAIILPGFKLKQGCIIGAGVAVPKDIPENSILAGVPTQLILQKLD